MISLAIYVPTGLLLISLAAGLVTQQALVSKFLGNLLHPFFFSD